jgi:hypothetical protein
MDAPRQYTCMDVLGKFLKYPVPYHGGVAPAPPHDVHYAPVYLALLLVLI